MPLVSKTILNTLCSALKNKNKEIFVPVYKKKLGNPLAFKYSMIKSLKKIKGDRGAKKLIKARIIHSNSFMITFQSFDKLYILLKKKQFKTND